MSEFVDRTRQVRSGEELDSARLAAFLGQRLPGGGELAIEQFPAGHSNLTYAVRRGDQEYVLRRPPFGSKVKSAHDMGREYRVLSKLHAVYPLAPRPILACDDPEVLGAPFYLMERIRGVILRKDLPPGLEFPPATARGLGESFIDNLADLHAIDFEAIGLGDLGKPAGYVARQVRGWIERYAGSQTEDVPEVAAISGWLTENMPPESGAALIHNDYKYDNVVLEPRDITRLIGVLDWEMSTLGDPLMDLGTTISYWIDPHDSPELQLIRWAPTTEPGNLTRPDLVARYAARTGRDVSRIVYYYAFALFKTAVIAQQIYYRYHHGLTQDARFGFFGEAAKIMFRAALASAESGKI